MTDKTADKTEVKLPVIKEATARVTGIVADGVSVAKDGTFTNSDNLYVSTLPEGLTADDVEKVRAHDVNFIAGATHAIGNAAVKAFKDNKDLAELTTSVDMLGGKQLGINIDREVTYPGMKDAPPTTKHGVVTVKVTDTSSKASNGQLGAVRTHINHAAGAALASSNK